MKKLFLIISIISFATYSMEPEIKLEEDLHQSEESVEKRGAEDPYYCYFDEPNQHIVARHSVSDQPNNVRTVTILHLDFKQGHTVETEAFVHPIDYMPQQKSAQVDTAVEEELFSRACALRAQVKAQQHDKFWEAKEAKD